MTSAFSPVSRLLSVGLVLAALSAAARTPNYDESKAGVLGVDFKLEDPLTFVDGSKVTSAADWERRRAEIVAIFAREMYGQTPPKPEAVVADLVEEGPTLAGLAIRRQYRMWFKADRSGPFVDWLVVIPNRIQGVAPQIVDKKVVCENTEKCPVVLMLNYAGNHTLLDDPEVVLPEGTWLRPENRTDSLPHDSERGRRRKSDSAPTYPLEYLVARGYAFVTACYGQVSPDAETRQRKFVPESYAYEHGVFRLWGKRDESRGDNITAIGAWAWALSRGLDLAYTIPEIDAEKSVATGFSRLGKTALLAASRDTRFKVCVPNQTGGGGAPLARRNYGENIGTECKMFPHWYCRNYCKYADKEELLTFDQHLLLASIAPRALMVQGYNSGWFDPKGEFLSCQAASPAWEFLGKKGLSVATMPDNYSQAGCKGDICYFRRGGNHGMGNDDWIALLDLADRTFGKR